MQEIRVTLRMDAIGGVTIPKDIRDLAGVKPADYLEIVITKGISAKSGMQENPLEAISAPALAA
jgi:bifunctional DNA-binding transcriptional regulator/antitoxin component of YhaV-PrlF toxin-antitoxin module